MQGDKQQTFVSIKRNLSFANVDLSFLPVCFTHIDSILPFILLLVCIKNETETLWYSTEFTSTYLQNVTKTNKKENTKFASKS